MYRKYNIYEKQNRALHMRAIVWGVVIFAALLGTTLAVPAFSQTEEPVGCSLTYFDPHCSPSGWLSFVLGDLVIAILLAWFLHHLGAKSNAKIDATTHKIEEILQHGEEARNRRTIFVCQSLKDGFGVIVVSAGLMNMKLKMMKSEDDMGSQLDEQHDAMDRAIHNARNVVDMGVETLDPMLIEGIYKLLNYLESMQISDGIGAGLPGYGDIKTKIHTFTEHLNGEVERIKNPTSTNPSV